MINDVSATLSSAGDAGDVHLLGELLGGEGGPRKIGIESCSYSLGDDKNSGSGII
jgi:hypothetical protein